MTDISAALSAAAEERYRHRDNRGIEVVDQLAHVVGGQIDWDEDASEDWATVAVGDEAAIYINLRARLLVVEEQFEQEVRDALPPKTIIVVVPDMDAVVLTADADALSKALGEGAVELAETTFSAGDLWFYSI